VFTDSQVYLFIAMQVHETVSHRYSFIGRPFVKCLALYYRSVVCPVLSVCNVGTLWPNGWMDQDETWHAGRPRPRTHCVRWGPSFPAPKGAQPPSNFRPICVVIKGRHESRCHLVTWYGGRPRFTQLPSRKGRGSWVPNFWPMSVVAKRQDGLRCHLVWR